MSKFIPLKLSKNSSAIAGEFAVLSQLALRGFDANITLGNTKGVDILASSPTSGKMYRIEVKTRYQQTIQKSKFFGHNLEWHMSKKQEEIKDANLFYCFVDISERNNSFRFFIVPSVIVAEYVRNQHKAYLIDKPHNKDTDLRMFRLSETPELPAIFKSLPAKEYEDKWEFFIG